MPADLSSEDDTVGLVKAQFKRRHTFTTPKKIGGILLFKSRDFLEDCSGSDLKEYCLHSVRAHVFSGVNLAQDGYRKAVEAAQLSYQIDFTRGEHWDYIADESVDQVASSMCGNDSEEEVDDSKDFPNKIDSKSFEIKKGKFFID